MADRAIDCDSNEYQGYRIGAIIATLVTAVGIPVLSCGVVLLVARVVLKGSIETSVRLFFFTTGGFHRSFWFWEATTLIRKALFVVVLRTLSSQRLALLLATWIASRFFCINAVVKPFQELTLSKLEALSLATIAVTFNLALLYEFTEEDAAEYWALSCLILGMNGIVFLIFLVALLRALIQKLRSKLSEQTDDDDGDIIDHTLTSNQGAIDRLRDELASAHARQHALLQFFDSAGQ